MGIFEYADPSVTDKTRIIRVLNTKNTKSGFYKVDIEKDWLFHQNAKELITDRAKRPNKLLHNYLVTGHDTVFDVVDKIVESEIEPEIESIIFKEEGRQRR